ncbi:hypothetical protein BP5796_02745 [Coleophoma crateriformis]|uniref:Uncharacterized protein n=1 Tax=Coleophoma crateriformis TaxID=565419 RepID=A0A3D8SZ70_9HELO|nr:hypothetical protein BP5796_02745 [Coleophoma crateriformis]
MQFSTATILAALSFSSQVFAAPVAPAKRDMLVTVHSAVTTFHSEVTTELTSISSTVKSDVTTSIVPSVTTNLVSIAGSVNKTIDTIVPAIAGPVVTLSVSEVASIYNDLVVVKSVLSNVETVLNTTVTGVLAETKTLLAPEISAVLVLVTPLVNPLVAYVKSVVGTVTGADNLVSEVFALCSDIESVAGGIVDPVMGLVSIL